MLGCDEVFSNIIKHAYCCQTDAGNDSSGPAYGSGPAYCKVEATSRAFVIHIEHQGEGISTAKMKKILEEPLPSPTETIGGLGIHVIGKIFDKIDICGGSPTERPGLVLTKHWE